MSSHNLTPEALEYFREMGRQGGIVGGKKSAANLTKKERRLRALKAVQAREAKRAQAKKPA
jgi:hypothetical protein